MWSRLKGSPRLPRGRLTVNSPTRFLKLRATRLEFGMAIWGLSRALYHNYTQWVTHIFNGSSSINLQNESYVYWTVHHLTSWINRTNLMSLYESFLLLNLFRMLLHSSSGADDCMWVYCSVSVCAGVMVRFGWSRVVRCRLEHYRAPTCIRIPPHSSRTAPIHQYIPKQSNTPTYSRQLLRSNVITFETSWAIKNFHKVTSSWFNLFNKLFSFIYRCCVGYIRCRVLNGMVFVDTMLQKNGCKESLPILAHLRKRTQHTEIYTGCNITQNTYIQSWTVTEIKVGEVWKFDSCYSLTDYQIHIETGRNMWFL
jgi:hypothetical protein